MVLLKTHRYSFKHLERIIKYVPILNSFFCKNSFLKKILTNLYMNIEFMSGKIFTLYTPLLKLIHGSIYLGYHTIFTSIQLEHNRYMEQLKMYNCLQLDNIVNALENYLESFLFMFFNARLISPFEIKYFVISNKNNAFTNIMNIFIISFRCLCMINLHLMIIISYIILIYKSILYNFNYLIKSNNYYLFGIYSSFMTHYKTHK